MGGTAKGLSRFSEQPLACGDGWETMMCIPPFCCGLSDFHFFLHVYLLALCVVEFVLQEGQLLAGDYFHAEAKAPLPAFLDREQPLVEVSSHVGMHVQGEVLDAQLVVEKFYLALEHLVEEETALDCTCSVTSGAGLIHLHVHHGTHTLACDLHKPELGQGQDVVVVLDST